MRFAQFVIGPAGCGKSTYCAQLQRHAADANRVIEIVNLDPAAERFDYEPLADIRELIQVDDVMEDEDLQFGPNGGLVYCLEHLIENQDWLHEQLCGGGDDADVENEPDDDYILFDMPGQIELYTHLEMGRKLVDLLTAWNFRVCSVYIMDSQFMLDGAKFLSGTMAALSVMTNIEMPHVNVLSKMDLLSKASKSQLEQFIEPDPKALMAAVGANTHWGKKYDRLTEVIGNLIEDFSLVRFHPLNIQDEESLADLLLIIDNIIQYDEDREVKMRDFDPPEEDEIIDDDFSKIFT